MSDAMKHKGFSLGTVDDRGWYICDSREKFSYRYLKKDGSFSHGVVSKKVSFWKSKKKAKAFIDGWLAGKIFTETTIVWGPMDKAPRNSRRVMLWHKTHKCVVVCHWRGGLLPWVESTGTCMWPNEAFTGWAEPVEGPE